MVTIKVQCPECNKRFNEMGVETINIESDVVGRDVVTFTCPDCNKNVKSLRYTIR